MIGGISIENIIIDLTKYDCDYVLIGETSMNIRGVGTTLGYPVNMQYSGNILYKTHNGYTKHTKIKSVKLDEIIEVNGFICTNQLRTIREMIKEEIGSNEQICFDIFDYVDKNSLDELYAYAVKWKFKEDLDFYIDELGALEIYEE